MRAPRQFVEVHDTPQAGDIVELLEDVESIEKGEPSFEFEWMVRVVAVAEDHVWLKQYGKGYAICSLKAWRRRLETAKSAKVFQHG